MWLYIFCTTFPDMRNSIAIPLWRGLINQCKYKIYIDFYRTSQRTNYALIWTTSRFTIYREVTDVYCDNNAEHINTLWAQKTDIFMVKTWGNYSLHSGLKQLIARDQWVCISTLHSVNIYPVILGTKYMHRGTDGWMDGRTDGRTDGRDLYENHLRKIRVNITSWAQM